MSDRCYIKFKIRKADLPSFVELLGEEFWDDMLDENDVMMEIDKGEANYAWTDELRELAAKGAVFSGYHAEGGNFDSYTFVGVGGQYFEMRYHEGQAVVPVDKSGEVSENDRAYARLFFEKRKAAEEALKVKKEETHDET